MWTAAFLLFLLLPCAHTSWSLFKKPEATSANFRYYVMDVKDTPWDVRSRTTNIEDVVLSKLQCLGYSVDEGLELYDSNYNLVDQWYLVHLLNSPLRVDDPYKADAVFIPTRYNLNNHDPYKLLLDHANLTLPLLGKIPHFVILGAPRQTHVLEGDPLVTHPVAKEHFLYLTMVVPDFLGNDVHDLSTFVTIPYFHQVHWTLESMQQHRPFNATAVLANKRHWAAHAYAVRPIWHKASDNAIHSRIYLYQQCVAAGKQACSFVKSEARDWAAVFRASAASLFTAQPRGDWVSRCSISDVLAAGSIPLVPLEDFGPYMPFTDVLDWRSYTEDKEVNRTITWTAPAPTGNTTSNTTSNADPTPVQRDDFQNATFSEALHDRKVECSCQGQHHVATLQARYSNSKMAVLPKLHAVHRVRQVYQYALEPDWLTVRWEDVAIMSPTDDALTFSLKALMRRMCLLGLSDKCPAGISNPAAQRLAMDAVVEEGGAPEWLSQRSRDEMADSRRMRHRQH